MISAAGWPECTQVMQLQPNEEIKTKAGSARLVFM